MATVGQSLTAPEAGWKRFEETDTHILKKSGTWYAASGPNFSGGSRIYSNTASATLQFTFTGTKLRIIGHKYSAGTNSVDLYIDGIKIDTFSGNAVTEVYQALCSEKLGLVSGKHSVKLVNSGSGFFSFDAIDIDSFGGLIPFEEAPINLTAIAGDSLIDLSWNVINGATGYNIKRSTTVGGPYTVIASNLAGGNYIDTSVTNGTTYYYILNAVTTAGESGNSNEVSATPIAGLSNLIAIAGDSLIDLSWNAANGVSSYNVKRSLTVGGPYTTIANNVPTNSYIDTEVVNGTTYFYVVTAITADGESANSNEASATPTAPPVEEGEAVLRVTMIDSSEREYKVSKVVANDFVAWCNRAIGTGNSCYIFDKGLQDSKEYLFYEKIISFEVIPLA
jgi:hypothetical protein